jgi:YgiT-type zinc finger domain-containing protein
MIGKRERDNGRCPLCGGRLVPDQRATIPFVLEDTVAIIKDVPAAVCASCHEPFVTGEVTDRLVELIQQLRSLQTEVSVVSYSSLPVAA